MSDAGEPRQATFFQRYLLPAFALKGVIIGGGYATGRELAEYFLSHGPRGALLAMLLATAIWSLVAAIMILPVLRHIPTRRNALAAGAIAGPMAMLPGFVFLLAMIAFYPAILSQTLPSDFLLQQMNVPGFRILFQVMVFGALLESGVGVVHAVNERASVAWRARRSAEPPRWLRPGLTLALLVLCMFIADRIGLVTLIASGYRVMAIVFLLVFVLPLVTLGAAKLWRERAPALTSEEAAHV